MFCSIAELLMTDKTERQRMPNEPGAPPPPGLTMDNCLQLMPAPSLIFISFAMPFWPLLTRIFKTTLCKLTGHR